jgi:hypothetical protein
MSYEIPKGLSPFVCPLIVSPAESLGEPKPPLCVPPFTGIDLTWEGFTIPHLRLIGINVTKPWLRKPLIKLALDHETEHAALSLATPYLRYTNYEMVNFYRLIFDTFMEGGEKIEVPLQTPLRYDQVRNKLEQQWALLTLLKHGSRLIEEVCAVRFSILRSQRYIEPEIGKKILSHYKRVYEKRIPGFQRAYEALDFIAITHGDTIAKGIVPIVLSTGNPETAFWDIVRELSHKDTSFLANLSPKEVCDYFDHFLDSLDKDDLRYRRKALRERIEMFEQRWWPLIEDGWRNFYDFFLDPSKEGLVFAQYTSDYYDIDLQQCEEVGYGHFYILLEVVRQALVTGKGLLCHSWQPDTQCW